MNKIRMKQMRQPEQVANSERAQTLHGVTLRINVELICSDLVLTSRGSFQI